MKKWYVFDRTAEGCALFFVKLTPNELQTICNFLCQQCNGPDEGYSGRITLLFHEGFDSREEAEEYVHEHNRWPYV